MSWTKVKAHSNRNTNQKRSQRRHKRGRGAQHAASRQRGPPAPARRQPRENPRCAGEGGKTALGEAPEDLLDRKGGKACCARM